VLFAWRKKSDVQPPDSKKSRLEAGATKYETSQMSCGTVPRLPVVQMESRRETSMTIQITKPEVEALINQRLQSGGYKDAEDVILQALQSSPAKPPAPRQPETAHSQRNL
jgi:hypothetical protein